jgi:hypothetical protein
MTLTIRSIDHEGPGEADQNPNAVHRFWTAAGDVFIKIARDQPDIQQLVYAIVDAGGDIEITAHNREGRISVTVAEASGRKYVVFDDHSGDHSEGTPLQARHLVLHSRAPQFPARFAALCSSSQPLVQPSW